MPHVLVVDDDADLSAEIALYLESQGFFVSTAGDASQMDNALAAAPIDIIVLDLMLPGESGLSVCQRLNAAEHPPILILSAIGEDVDRIVGLELGADDYLAKPCLPRELLARLRAILRHTGERGSTPNSASLIYGFRGFRFNLVTRQLIAPTGVAVPLTAGQFLLLRAFVERPKQVMARDELLEASRGDNTDIFDRAIDVQLSRLRGKLSNFTEHALIKTCRGSGYVFDERVIRI
jgi:two-component system OmpR family response regulator